jgi:hypothetical protein
MISSTNYHNQVSALEKLHAKHALPGFADRTAEEREIEAATTDITRVHHSVQPLSSPTFLHVLLFFLLLPNIRTSGDAILSYNALARNMGTRSPPQIGINASCFQPRMCREG